MEQSEGHHWTCGRDDRIDFICEPSAQTKRTDAGYAAFPVKSVLDSGHPCLARNDAAIFDDADLAALLPNGA